MQHSLVQHEKLPIDFYITDSPLDATKESYLAALESRGIKTIIKLSTTSYDTEFFANHGISVIDLGIQDGTTPSDQVLEQWIGVFSELKGKEGKNTVAIHCVSGLGRAPLFVCVALVNCGVDPVDAIEFVRSRRRGSLNKNQVDYLIRQEVLIKRDGKKKQGLLKKLFSKQ